MFFFVASLSCAEIGYCTNCASIKNFEKKFPDLERLKKESERERGRRMKGCEIISEKFAQI